MESVWPGTLFGTLHLPKIYPWLTAFLLSLGALTAAKFAVKTASVLAQTFFLPGRSLNSFKGGKASWAVVTGASDGIGREFALQLARAGFNIVLVARNHAKLSDVAAEIENGSLRPVETKIYVIDFAKHEPSAYDGLRSLMDSLNVGILVNNAGLSLDIPTYFTDVDEQKHDDIVTVNVKALLRVTHTVLPGMIHRKRGLILNIGSFAGMIPSPMLATYSATKAFVCTFSSALAEEVRQHNIFVQNTNTYFVVSKMSGISETSLFVPSAEAYVRSALRKISLSCGSAFTGRPETVSPYWSHALLDYTINLIGWKSRFIAVTHDMHKEERSEILSKLEQEKRSQ
ncbi:hypothetical protein HYDPIDRAFT_174673 [Hydnomerulius pinastri MD-312]|nr:hypothetical protein HYDPIDRAFT_174673 [Hydnomerulius pinastri MD-312]